MSSADSILPNSLKTDDELMTVLHDSMVWKRLADITSSSHIYTNLRGALEDAFDASRKGASIAFLSNTERGICIGVDQIKSLWKRIGLV
jgi:hypothetical protein